jgi:hypothetical protein
MIEECWFAKNAATLTKQVFCNADVNDGNQYSANRVLHDQSKKSEISLVFADRTEEILTTTTTHWIGGADCTAKGLGYVDTVTALN